MKFLLGLMLSMGGLQETQTGIINGRVTNATGTEGIPGVSVLLAGPLTGAAANAATSNPLMIEEIAEGSGTRTTRATTDGSGGVVFRNLALGQYMLKVQQEGYRSTVPTPTGAMPTMATALTAVGIGPADVMIPLFREAVVSGRVRDAAGRPLPGATVGAYFSRSNHAKIHHPAAFPPAGMGG